MHGWNEVHRLNASDHLLEKDLQSIFDGWGSRRSRWLFAGVPDWIWSLGRPEPRSRRAAFGLEFRPDVLWSDQKQKVVAELKYGAKFEPIAIAEVLHHAHMLRLLENVAVTPLIVSQHNHWIRAAIRWMRRPALRHVEVDLLNMGGRPLCWISDPHAKLHRSTPPRDLPPDKTWRLKRWWRVADEPTWILSDTRPKLFHEGAFTVISKIRQTGRYVRWSGTLPKLRDRWSSRQWARSGAYWVSSPASRRLSQQLPASS